MWQPREVCNHLNQLVKSPLISRVHSLDLRTRKWLKETQSLVANLNNVDIGKP
jgi:hypothetical protein